MSHVTDVYSTIAKHFSDTRYSHWKAVKDFLLEIPKYSIVLDIGCGNGKYSLVRNDLIFLAFDITHELLTIAKETKKGSIKDFMHGSCIHTLPIINKIANYAICIAVIHHLASHTERVQTILNILTKIADQGSLLITVWAYEQIILPKWKHIEDTDYLIPWLDKYSHKTHWRYYHLFTEEEIHKLCKEVKDHIISIDYNISFEHNNWVILFNLRNKNLS